MEVWKDVKGYEGSYQVSNTGNVKSLNRIVLKGIYSINIKERILVNFKNSNGYLHVELNKKGVGKKIKVHILMAIAFLNHIPNGKHDIVIDHIDNDKNNNHLENLQLISNRENCSKEQRGFSKYTGVSFAKREKKWRAYIYFNSKLNHLGYFKTEIEAYNAYQKKLKEIC